MPLARKVRVAQPKYTSRGGRGYRATNARCRSARGKRTLAISKLHTEFEFCLVSSSCPFMCCYHCLTAQSSDCLLTGCMFTTMAPHLPPTLVPTLFSFAMRNEKRDQDPMLEHVPPSLPARSLFIPVRLRMPLPLPPAGKSVSKSLLFPQILQRGQGRVTVVCTSSGQSVTPSAQESWGLEASHFKQSKHAQSVICTHFKAAGISIIPDRPCQIQTYKYPLNSQTYL